MSSQRGQRLNCDVLVVGTGIAGLVYALELTDRHPELAVMCVSKQELGEGNSRYAQGGIASVAAADDSVEAHVEDTLAAGAGLCHPAAVRDLLEAAPACLARLVSRGVPFDRQQPTGNFDLTLEGGHSHRRIYHAGDHTGAAVIETLVALLRARSSVTVLEHHSAVNLICQNATHAPGARPEVLGAYVLEGESGSIHTIRARLTVLATGGAGKTYRFTTNSETATGDGIAMAYRAGARVGNLEFFQFHPTLLYHPEVNNFLLTEALRGEGAHLRMPESGDRFMLAYAPDKAELATRDVVARAIFTELERTDHSHVYLDIRHRDTDFLDQHFPVIRQTLLGLGLDLAKDLIPVVPAAHYLCGGVLTDCSGRTDLDRLLVIGESAFTGLHGANRLASNSLLEGLVMGEKAAQISDEFLDRPVELVRDVLDWDSQCVRDARRASQITAHWQGLRGEMTSFAGIVRTEQGLQDLLNIVGIRRDMIEGYYWSHLISRDLLELRNIALVSELIARSALHRRESRGGHFREDYPDAVPDTQDTILRYQEQYPTASSHFERPRA